MSLDRGITPLTGAYMSNVWFHEWYRQIVLSFREPSSGSISNVKADSFAGLHLSKCDEGSRDTNMREVYKTQFHNVSDIVAGWWNHHLTKASISDTIYRQVSLIVLRSPSCLRSDSRRRCPSRLGKAASSGVRETLPNGTGRSKTRANCKKSTVTISLKLFRGDQREG